LRHPSGLPGRCDSHGNASRSPAVVSHRRRPRPGSELSARVIATLLLFIYINQRGFSHLAFLGAVERAERERRTASPRARTASRTAGAKRSGERGRRVADRWRRGGTPTWTTKNSRRALWSTVRCFTFAKPCGTCRFRASPVPAKRPGIPF